MNGNARIIVIRIDGKITSHIPAGKFNYATLCGLDGDDPAPAVQQEMIGPGYGQVDCADCFDIWKTAGNYTAGDFSLSARGDAKK